MIGRVLAVAIALAAAAPPASAARAVTWTDRSGDANVVGSALPVGSQPALDVVGARLVPFRGSGISVRIDFLGVPKASYGTAVWFAATRGACTVTAQWSGTLVSAAPRALVVCPDGPRLTRIGASVEAHAVVLNVPRDALPDARGAFTGIAVGTSLADPVSGTALTRAAVDTAAYDGSYAL